MTVQVSTGLSNALLDTGSLKAALNLGFIKIYEIDDLTGAPPASADEAVTGTLLCTISVDGTGTGLTLGAAASGAIPKTSSETWSGVNAASGTAGYWRWVAPGDDGTLSTTQKRLQGTCGTSGSGADMTMPSLSLEAGVAQPIDAASITLPTT